MRAIHLWRLIAALLLVAGTLAMPVLDYHTFVVVADDDDDGGDDDNDDNGNGRDDDDNGNGRDSDSDDDNGRGNSRDSDDDDDDDNGRGNGRDKDDDDDEDEPVGRSAGYRVEVECTVTGDANESECLFTIVGDNDDDVDRLLIPETSVCAEVLDGDFEYVEADDDGDFSGFRSEDDDDDEPLSLTLDGAVFPSGTTTYWFESDERVFPAMGPGLVCGEAGESAPDPAVAATPPLGDGAGTVVVQAHSCVGVPTDTSAYDWYGECDAGAAGQAYVLTPLDAGKDEVLAAETDDAGAATFGAVTPGTWDLDDETANWCHAESDNVTTMGDVVVEAGQETTVWLFYCEDGS